MSTPGCKLPPAALEPGCVLTQQPLVYCLYRIAGESCLRIYATAHKNDLFRLYVAYKRVLTMS